MTVGADVQEQTVEQRRASAGELFGDLFLGPELASQDAYRSMINTATEVLIREFAASAKPYSGAAPESLLAALERQPVCPEEPSETMSELLNRLGADMLRHSAVVTHPACVAHLHCPPLMASLAAEAWIAASNQSMDSWDQSMAGTMLEEHVMAWLCGLYGLAETGDGVFTSGGTQSNLMGLLLARNHYAAVRWNWNVQQRGLPAASCRLRILCSEEAHFTVKQSAALLGLGEQAVVTIKTDSRHRMRKDDLLLKLKELKGSGLLPFALVATAGTTDFGAIDPLEELAAIARQNGMWFHVDAAYGGALAMSESQRARLRGIEEADSVTVDFHKGFYQPISCGAFLVRDKETFQSIRMSADYLNPESDEEAGVPNLVVKSIQTTRRFDALKLYLSLQHVGGRKFGEMVDHTVRLAQDTAVLIKAEPRLALLAEPELGTVVFRYMPVSRELNDDNSLHWADELNARIRDRLLADGWAVLARTRVWGRQCLKMTLLNPLTESAHTAIIIRKIVEAGLALETEQQAG